MQIYKKRSKNQPVEQMFSVHAKCSKITVSCNTLVLKMTKPAKTITIVHQSLGLKNGDRMVVDMAYTLKQLGMRVDILCNDRLYKYSKFLGKERIQCWAFGYLIPNSICGLFCKIMSYIKQLYLYIMYYLFLEDKLADLYIVSQVPVFVPILKYRKAKILYFYPRPEDNKIDSQRIISMVIQGIFAMFEEYAAGKSNAILVNSIYTKKRLFNFWAHLENKVHVIYPTILPPTYTKLKKASENRKFGNRDDLNYVFQESNIVFLGIARYEEPSDMEFMMKALHQMRYNIDSSIYRKVFLVLVNDYKVKHNNLPTTHLWYMQRLSLLAVKLDVMHQTIFVRDGNNRVRNKALVNCDAVVHAAHDHINYRNVQAMAFGRPVVCIKGCGSSEMFVNGCTGYITEKSSSYVQLGNLMVKIANCKDTNMQMGRAAKDHFHKCYGYTIFKQMLLEKVQATM